MNDTNEAFDTEFERWHIQSLLSQFPAAMKVSGTIEFIADDGKHTLAQTSFNISLELIDTLREDGFFMSTTSMLGVLLEYRGRFPELPTARGCIHLKDGAFSIEWFSSDKGGY